MTRDPVVLDRRKPVSAGEVVEAIVLYPDIRVLRRYAGMLEIGAVESDALHLLATLIDDTDTTLGGVGITDVFLRGACHVLGGDHERWRTFSFRPGTRLAEIVRSGEFLEIVATIRSELCLELAHGVACAEGTSPHSILGDLFDRCCALKKVAFAATVSHLLPESARRLPDLLLQLDLLDLDVVPA
jgi:hypothetical protein